MSRPLGFLLRSSRKPIFSPQLHRRWYSVPSDEAPVPGVGHTEQGPEQTAVDDEKAHLSQEADGSVPIRHVAYSSKMDLPGVVRPLKISRTPMVPDPNPNSTASDGIQLSDHHIDVRFPVNWKIDHFQLRDACKCPLCVDPHSKQRKFRTSDIPPTIKPRSVSWKEKGKLLEVKWDNDIPGFVSHTSTFDVRFLRSLSPYSPDPTIGRRKRYTWTGEQMKKSQTWISYDDYMNDDAKFSAAMKSLSLFGLIFIKDIPESREMVEKIATRMGPLRNSFYGSTWDVRTVPEAKNVAYTNQDLGFHMDLMYMNEPPGYQLLHCIQNSCDGGESLFADTLRAARLLRRDKPDFFELLRTTKLNYEYVHDDHVYFNSWPVIETYYEYGHHVPFRVNYSPPFQGPFYGSGGVVEQRDFRELRTALRKFVQYLEDKSGIFELKMQPGQCVIFENRRVVHARRAFNTGTGERWLAGAYVDDDAVRSKMAVLKRQRFRMTKPGAHGPEVYDAFETSDANEEKEE